MSASQLRHEFRKEVLDGRLKHLRHSFIEDVVNAGYSREEAAGLIDNHLIGWKKPVKGFAAIYASPEVIDRLREEKERMRVPVGWQSASSLEKAGTPRSKVSGQSLAKLRTALTEDIQLSGYTRIEAEALVEDHLIGTRRLRTGSPTLFASPEVTRLLLEAISPAENSLTKAKGPLLPSDEIASDYLKITQKLEDRGDRDQAERFYRKIVSEFRNTAEGIVAKGHAERISMCRSNSGPTRF